MQLQWQTYSFLLFITWAGTYWMLHFHDDALNIQPYVNMSNFGQIIKEVEEFDLFQ